jgi:DNA-binding transcriptional ArsR family regulator
MPSGSFQAGVVTDAMFRALADPTRRALFERLSHGGEATVHALTAGSGVSQPAISKHLGQLKAAGLVQGRRDGRETHYGARPEGVTPLYDWMRRYTDFWNERLDDLEDLLKRMDQ